MTDEISKPHIKDCFFRTPEGKCVSPEIYRFIPEAEETGKCPFDPNDEVVMRYRQPMVPNIAEKLRCLEFRPKR